MTEDHLKFHNPFWIKIKRQVTIISLMAVLFITLLPVALLIILPASILLRILVKLIAAGFRPDLAQIFRGKGVIFALESIYTRPKFNMLLHLFCDNGPLPVEQFRLQFAQRVLNYTDEGGAHSYEKLAQTWTDFMGFVFWKWDANFKLENHIRLYDYTEPELALPATCTEDDLKRITGDLIAKPWVEGQSPWEILIVPDYRTKQEPEKAGSVAILRIHHAMIDGYSIITMLLRFSNSLNVKRVLPTFPKLSPLQQLTRPLLLLLKVPYDFAEFAVQSFDGPNSWNFLEKKLCRKYHVFFSDLLDVEKIKEIRRKYGVDFNATIYAISAGSIRRLMLDSGHELPDSLSVFVPFPLPNHPGGLVVHTTAVCFKICPRISSAQDRIRQVANNLTTVQELPTGPTNCGWFADICALFPRFLMGVAAEKMTMTLGMTSMPGPEVEIPMVGDARLTSVCWVFGHMSNVAAITSMMTMAGKIRIALTVDKSVFEGYTVPTRFPEFVNQEIQELLNKKEN